MYGSKVKASGKKAVTRQQIISFQRHAMQIRRAINHFNKDKRDRQLDYLYTKTLEDIRDMQRGLPTQSDRWLGKHAGEILRIAEKQSTGVQAPQEDDDTPDIVDEGLKRRAGYEPDTKRVMMMEE
jgi:hypothetical protein